MDRMDHVAFDRSACSACPAFASISQGQSEQSEPSAVKVAPLISAWQKKPIFLTSPILIHARGCKIETNLVKESQRE
ncbi:MAG: hypothetical protein H7839_14805, partial [Magnetococcus sp. YQC-5]